MAGASTGLHEREDVLSPEARDLHRALVSIQEELEAVDWYRQRAEAAADAELRDILLHNMREEMEHASMLLEWVRRRSTDMDRVFRTYLFSEGPITAIEEEVEKKAPATENVRTVPVAPPLSIGTLKGA